MTLINNWIQPPNPLRVSLSELMTLGSCVIMKKEDVGRMYDIIFSMTGERFMSCELWVIAVPILGKRIQRQYPWIKREMDKISKDIWRDTSTTDRYLRYFADTYNKGEMYVTLIHRPPTRTENVK